MQKEITSVSQYPEIIRRLDKAYAKDGGLNNPVSSKFLYRGMAHVSWPLLPGIFREIGEQNYMKLLDEDCPLCDGDESDDFLYQFVIPVCAKQQIVRELNMLGINGKSLFPGLDGVGKHIERIYRFDYQKNLSGV